MGIVLSILVLRMHGREEQYARLIESIGPAVPEVEVLYELDGGEMNVGAKRNRLLGRARGRYVAFVDDDDTVEGSYVETILGAIEAAKDPDCVEMRGRIFDEEREEWRQFRHSIRYAKWYTGSDGIYYRTPNHLNPVRASIAREVRFRADLTAGEDQDYSNRIRHRLRTEGAVDHVIYCYTPSYAYRDQLAQRGMRV